eukprot:9561855-Lingulodinium_polyedra.AAC.1
MFLGRLPDFPAVAMSCTPIAPESWAESHKDWASRPLRLFLRNKCLMWLRRACGSGPGRKALLSHGG